MLTRNLASVFWAVSMLAAATGCQSDVDAKLALAGLSNTCRINSDCNTSLVCVFERCHEQCSSSRDCDRDARCVAGQGKRNVCQLADEAVCSEAGFCPGTQVCGADAACRDACSSDGECLAEQLCSGGTCADTAEAERVRPAHAGACAPDGGSGAVRVRLRLPGRAGLCRRGVRRRMRRRRRLPCGPDLPRRPLPEQRAAQAHLLAQLRLRRRRAVRRRRVRNAPDRAEARSASTTPIARPQASIARTAPAVCECATDADCSGSSVVRRWVPVPAWSSARGQRQRHQHAAAASATRRGRGHR